MSRHMRHAGAVGLLLQAQPPGYELQQVRKPSGGIAVECWTMLAEADMACVLAQPQLFAMMSAVRYCCLLLVSRAGPFACRD